MSAAAPAGSTFGIIDGMSETKTPAEEPAHDVLAAEAFGLPGPDPSLDPRPVVLPSDPTGIEEPHDVLSAEDYAIPAPPPGYRPRISLQRGSRARRILKLAGAGAAMAALFRRRGRQ